MDGNDFYEDKLSRVGGQHESITSEQKNRIRVQTIDYLRDLHAYMDQNPAFSECDRLTRPKEDWERPDGMMRLAGSFFVGFVFCFVFVSLFPFDSDLVSTILIVGPVLAFYVACTKYVKRRMEAEKIMEKDLLKELKDHYDAYLGERLLSSYEVTSERIYKLQRILSSRRAYDLEGARDIFEEDRFEEAMSEGQDELAENPRRTADAATVAAVFAAGTYFNTRNDD